MVPMQERLLVPWLATTVTFRNITTCPGFKGHYGVHAEVNGARGKKGITGTGTETGTERASQQGQNEGGNGK